MKHDITVHYMMQELIKNIEENLGHSLCKDRHRLDRKLQRLKRSGATEQTTQLEKLLEETRQSREKLEHRRALVPELIYPDLPVSDKRQDIEDAIRHHQVVVVCGETGSGKTTQLPKICLEIGQGVRGTIAHTQPRRIAARAVADRIASELQTPLGQTVGYKIRFQDQSNPYTLVKLMTDGILLAEIQSDPFLNSYDTIIIDEAHERTLNIDFLLGYLKWLLPKRPDLKLIITSATIDPQRFSRHFDDAPVIEVSGRTYPVEIRYLDEDMQGDEEDGPDDATLYDQIQLAVEQLQREMDGDILIFMSGERDIRDLSDFLRKRLGDRSEILPLFSRLSNAEQQRIFRTGGKRRIVISTNVAETSLTVPGIRCVIDTGKARISRYSHRSKLQRLPVEKISRASANQRSGRCGRVAAGICMRMYSEADFNNRPEFTEPEIVRTNLASVILQMSALGLGDIGNFPFVDRPSDKMIRDGVRQLHELNAIDQGGRLTATGKQLARFPIDPRLGRMLIAAVEENCLQEVLVIVAALSVQDPRERPMDAQQASDQKHARYHVEGSDLMAFVKLWDVLGEKRQELSGNRFKRYCQENYLSVMRIREWQDVHQQLMQLVRENRQFRLNTTAASQEAVHRAMIPGLLSLIGFRHEQSEYLGARNLKFQIHPGSSLFKSKPKWIMVCEQVETSRAYGRNVARIDPRWVEQAAEHLLQRQYYEPHWEKKQNRAAIYERVTLYGLILSNGRRVPYEQVDPAAAREMFIRSALVEQQFRTSAAFFRNNQRLLAELGNLEDKGRRLDLGADEEWLYAFYDERIPATVVNGVTFQRWLDDNHPAHEQLLSLSRDSVLQDEADEVNAKDYPDYVTVRGMVFQLDYRFEPGHRDDGVTARFPLHQLNQMRMEDFQWLVPGLLEEKLVALIKSLPKSIRRNFVPVPDFASRCMSRLDPEKADLLPQLADCLRDMTGVSIDRSAWREEILPEHLKMNFHLQDEQGKLLEVSRDLQFLQQRHGKMAGQQFESLATASLAHTDCQDWTFGALPKMYQGKEQGKSLSGFPAIVDEGTSVGVRIFDSERKADSEHRLGLIRLLNLRLKKDVRYLERQVSTKAGMAYQRLPESPFPAGKSASSDDQPAYAGEIINCVLSRVFLDDGEDLREAAQLDRRIDQRKNKLVSTFAEVEKVIDQIMLASQQLRSALDERGLPEPIRQDLRKQLGLLVYRGFLLDVPFSAVEHYPRYLRGMDLRMQKARQDPSRDLAKLDQLNQYWQPYWDRVGDSLQELPQQAGFRWALEEYRVSLFAQALKTAYPVSDKRLDKLWQELVNQ